MSSFFVLGLIILARAVVAISGSRNSSFTNPILPGWHSDPSCVFVPELDNTFFCATSTFLVFPGIPIYASKDLVSWKLVSNVFNRQEQLPDLALPVGQNDGIYAPTLRYHNGKFYLATAFINMRKGLKTLVFESSNPFEDGAWSIPAYIQDTFRALDPDIFWDDDGTAYIANADGGIQIYQVDLETSQATSPVNVWNGTGGTFPEGPHLYKKDGYYYLLIAEGGTELNHTVTIARSQKIYGPYESFSGNPILTNKNTAEYFQTVGHADLFQDKAGNWWGVALSTRSGPEWTRYPMGRETVLYPARWDKGEWPVLQPVRGQMTGWPLPRSNKNIPGIEAFVTDPDKIDFNPGSSLPKHLVHWRFPPPNLYTISPPHHSKQLRLTPSKSNLTGLFESTDPISFIGRRQTHTLFTFSVDVGFDPSVKEEEVGITAFLTQYQHIDLGIVMLPLRDGSLAPHLRFRTTAFGKPGVNLPETSIVLLPSSWLKKSIRLQIEAKSDTHYVFSAAPSNKPSEGRVIGYADVVVVSGGSGPFTGTLLGVYATSNGGSGSTQSYISRWRYTGYAQLIGNEQYVWQ